MSSVEQRVDLRRQIRNSSLWAAYGDAAGFITEFADRSRVQSRVGTVSVSTTAAWERKVGGQFGPYVPLPAGAISDDTQLRLATCRALSRGGFDVEAFSKIELTVWPSYALGAGRASKAAAAGLTRREASWANNFFSERGTRYSEAGGNGAAMRIQPHVWCAPADSPPGSWLRDVVANAICTHGHPRAIVGAVFHARCLEHVMRERRASHLPDWVTFADEFGEIPRVLYEDDTIRDLWLGPWEERAGLPAETVVANTADEFLHDLDRLSGIRIGDALGAYRSAVESLELFRPEVRGSGTKTAILAAVAASLFADDPASGIETCVNALGTDTDTIASMAGALLGATAPENPPGPVQDSDYILREADRMWAMASGHATPAFPYSDLLHWTPPKSQLDVVVLGREGEFVVSGLGPVDPISEPFEGHGRDAALWQWFRTWFGQTLLAKRRADIRPARPAVLVSPRNEYLAPEQFATLHAEGRDDAGVTVMPRQHPNGSSDVDAVLDRLLTEGSLHEITDYVIRSGFDDHIVGAVLTRLAGRDRPIEDAMGYAAIIVKALAARRDAQRRSS
jgi:ADP-ribosylglycohydrolase